MANKLIVHFPGSTSAFETDDIDKLTALSDFCKEELFATSEEVGELTIEHLPPDMEDKFYSLLFELDLL